MKVLLVEDEMKLTQALSHLSKKENIDMDIANSGDDGLYMARNVRYDVIVLDVMLPEMNGFEILKTLRNDHNNTPILMLTAKDTIEDKLFGFDLGADDYLPKPFNTKELFARIKTLSKRISTVFQGESLIFCDIIFQPTNSMLIIGTDEFILNKKESDVLEMFLRMPNQVISKMQLLDRVWGFDTDISENNVEIVIHSLRKKLGASNTSKIQTLRGSGYVLKEVNHV